MPSRAPRSLPHEHRDTTTGAYTVGVAVVSAQPHRRGWWGRMPMRIFGGAGRMIGVDVARGLAVLGLLCGVFGVGAAGGGGAGAAGAFAGSPAGAPGDALSPLAASAGPLIALVTTALFVLVSGVSASLMLRAASADAARARAAMTATAPNAALAASNVSAGLRVAVRAVLLFAAGAVGAAGVGVAGPATMLQLLGVLTFAALFVRRWRARTLFLVAAGCLLVLPAAELILGLWLQASTSLPPNAPETALASGTQLMTVAAAAVRSLAALLTDTAFPALTWCAPFLAGLAIGRLPRDRIWRPFALLAAGGSLFAIALAATLLVANQSSRADVAASLPGRVSTLLGSSLAPHLATIGLQPAAGLHPSAIAGARTVAASAVTQQAGVLDVLAATSIALTVLAICLLVGRPLRWLVFPVAALGSTALTASTIVLGLAVLVPRSFTLSIDAVAAVLPPGIARWSTLVAATLAWLVIAMAASVWRALLNAGPVERIVAGFSQWAISACRTRTVGAGADAGADARDLLPDVAPSWPSGTREPVPGERDSVDAWPHGSVPLDSASAGSVTPDPSAFSSSAHGSAPFGSSPLDSAPVDSAPQDTAATAGADPACRADVPADQAHSPFAGPLEPGGEPARTSWTSGPVTPAAPAQTIRPSWGAALGAPAPEPEQPSQPAPQQRFSDLLEEPAVVDHAAAGFAQPSEFGGQPGMAVSTGDVPGQPVRTNPDRGQTASRDRPSADTSATAERRSFRDRLATRQQKAPLRRSSFGFVPGEGAPVAEGPTSVGGAAGAEDARPAPATVAWAAAGAGAAAGTAVGATYGTGAATPARTSAPTGAPVGTAAPTGAAPGASTPAGALHERWPNPSTADPADVTPPPTPQWSPGQSLGRLPY